MNTIYIIFIIILYILFILGLFVNFFKTRNEMKLRKYNNEALKKDNYEYAKDYIYDTQEFNFTDKIAEQEEYKVDTKIEEKITENTIIIPILSVDDEEEFIETQKKETKTYAIMDDEIL